MCRRSLAWSGNSVELIRKVRLGQSTVRRGGLGARPSLSGGIFLGPVSVAYQVNEEKPTPACRAWVFMHALAVAKKSPHC